ADYVLAHRGADAGPDLRRLLAQPGARAHRSGKFGLEQFVAMRKPPGHDDETRADARGIEASSGQQVPASVLLDQPVVARAGRHRRAADRMALNRLIEDGAGTVDLAVGPDREGEMAAGTQHPRDFGDGQAQVGKMLYPEI